MVDGNDTKTIILPAPPRPVQLFSFDWSNQMNRWLTQLQAYVFGVHYGRFSSLYLAPESFPTSGYGLRAGEVFANAGVLTVVREGDIWMGSFAASAEIGELTVTIT
jgi:hypothetical protein